MVPLLPPHDPVIIPGIDTVHQAALAHCHHPAEQMTA